MLGRMCKTTLIQLVIGLLNVIRYPCACAFFRGSAQAAITSLKAWSKVTEKIFYATFYAGFGKQSIYPETKLTWGLVTTTELARRDYTKGKFHGDRHLTSVFLTGNRRSRATLPVRVMLCLNQENLALVYEGRGLSVAYF